MDGFYEQGVLIKNLLVETAEEYNLRYEEITTLFSKAIGLALKSKEPALISYTGKAYYFSEKDNAMRWKTINEREISTILKYFNQLIDIKLHNDVDLKMNNLIQKNDNVFFMKISAKTKDGFIGKLYANNKNKKDNYLLSNLEVTIKKTDLQKNDYNNIQIGNTILVSLLKFSYRDGKIYCVATRKKMKFIKSAIELVAIKTKIDIFILSIRVYPKTQTVALKLKKSLKNSKPLISLFVYRIQSIFGFKIVYNFY